MKLGPDMCPSLTNAVHRGSPAATREQDLARSCGRENVGHTGAKPRPLTGVCLLVLLCLHPATAGAMHSEQRPIRVGIFQNEPIVFQDESGVAQGLYVDLVNAIGKEEGWNIEYVLDSWDGCLKRLEARDIDLMTCIAYAAERDAFADWSREVVWTLWGVIFVRPESGIENVPSLAGKRVAILKGGINGLNFLELCSEFDISCDILPLSAYHAQLKAVESGEAEAAVVNSVFGTMHGAEYQVRQTPIVFSPVSAFFAVPEGTNGDLLKTIDHYLSRWKQDGDSVYYRSLRRWLSSTTERIRVIPGWIPVALSVLASGLLVLLLWTRLLGRAVNDRTAELQESESRFRHAVTESPFPIMIHAEDGEVLMISDVWTTLTGYTTDDIPTVAEWTRRAYGEDKQPAQDTIRKLYAIDSRVDEGDRTIATLSGERIVWSFSSAPLPPLPDGRRLVISMAMDITQRKQVEEELATHREHLEQLVADRTRKVRGTMKVMAGREVRMGELKKVIHKLRQQLLESGLEPVAADPVGRGKEASP